MPKTVPDSGALSAYQRESYIHILLPRLKARTAHETRATPSVPVDWTGTVLLPPSGKCFDMPHWFWTRVRSGKISIVRSGKISVVRSGKWILIMCKGVEKSVVIADE